MAQLMPLPLTVFCFDKIQTGFAFLVWSWQIMFHCCIYCLLDFTVAFSVPWCCWLGDRKGIQPVKTEWWGAGVVICLERGADLHTPSWCHCHSLSLASVKSRLVVPFWYRLTRVVLEKVPLNGCVCVLHLLHMTMYWHFSCRLYIYSKTSGSWMWPAFC